MDSDRASFLVICGYTLKTKRVGTILSSPAKLDKIIPTFLVFKVYPQITKINTLLLSVIKRAKAICIAIKEVYYL